HGRTRFLDERRARGLDGDTGKHGARRVANGAGQRGLREQAGGQEDEDENRGRLRQRLHWVDLLPNCVTGWALAESRVDEPTRTPGTMLACRWGNMKVNRTSVKNV